MLFLCIFAASMNLCLSLEAGTIAYSFRLKEVGQCGHPSDVASFNGSVTLYETTATWNGFINIARDFLIGKVIIQVEKCGEGYYPCEHFIRLNVNSRDLKEFALAKNQFWSPAYYTMVPKPKLPLLQKGLYRQVNTTFDIDAILKSVPEAANHAWKFRMEYYEKNTSEMICSSVQVAVYKYTVRKRLYRRKNSTAQDPSFI